MGCSGVKAKSNDTFAKGAILYTEVAVLPEIADAATKVVLRAAASPKDAKQLLLQLGLIQ